MSRVVFVSGLLLLVLVTAGCGFVRATGEIVTETRDVGSFDAVELRGSADVTIEIGDETSVTVETDSAVIDRITTEVVDDRLIIDQQDGRFLGVDRVHVAVTMPSVTGIGLDGSGTITADELVDPLTASLAGSGDIDLGGAVDRIDLVLDGSGSIDAVDLTARSATVGGGGSGDVTVMVDGSDLTVSVDGSLNITAAGVVDAATIAIDGSGRIAARDLTAGTAMVRVYGSGSVELSVVDALDVSITGSGDVVYRGDPEVSRDVTGSGGVHRG